MRNAVRRLSPALALFGVFTAVGLLFFTYYYLDDMARERRTPVLEPFIEEMTGAYAVALLFPLILLVARRWRLSRSSWLRLLPVHLAAMLLFSLAHTTLMALSREVLFPLAGLGDYDYGIMPVRYAMELANDVITYWMLVGAIYAFDQYRESRDREVRTAQLETRLTQAQLQNLRLQLQPHFLFNALNTVSSVMYESPRVADAMLARLGDLLRLSLGTTGAQETTLRQELEFLQLYVDIMRARFEERLTVRVSVDAALSGALVPPLLLQPLVENAIRHGNASRVGEGTIDVSARRDDGSLVLQVADDGPGLQEPVDVALAKGVGLANTAARLGQLYGRAHRFEIDGATRGGVTVTIAIPYRAADEAHAG